MILEILEVGKLLIPYYGDKRFIRHMQKLKTDPFFKENYKRQIEIFLITKYVIGPIIGSYLGWSVYDSLYG